MGFNDKGSRGIRFFSPKEALKLGVVAANFVFALLGTKSQKDKDLPGDYQVDGGRCRLWGRGSI